ncbi:glycerol-3-phosphate dehydrogenase subunit GlpB [Musicola paradisiaca]|uniref:Anaerobic glycerol-3-phosphate dehydrogenase subunit B n=1 Tax=Musicola paradisiaca (strain Ech703) TaxID=579405 RepID=C6C7E8_MUSP7|nr:glycerol-3-phosphate dehydrogenase subunit GlpB [Musicola paradisiaca]ACS84066.1 glycerol-3-phosphate dehydrogenase, anaerobic, B subunit [Musicola paradisiaca Ech703]
MRYDVIIIGGGLAGLTCGIRLQEQGKRCALVSVGQSALHFASGALDLLAALPDGTPVGEPLAALAPLTVQAPNHPYSLLGAEQIALLAPQAQVLLERCGLALRGDSERNHQRLTLLGKWQPCWLSPMDGVMRGLPGTSAWQRPLVAGIEGFLDFQAPLLSGALCAQGIDAQCEDLRLPMLDKLRQNPSEFRSLSIARVLETHAGIELLAEELSRLISDRDSVILPACLGMQPSSVARLNSALGKPVGLLATLPPSLPGMRLHQALLSRFRAVGGTVMAGDRVTGASFQAQGIEVATRAHGDIPLRATKVVLASGSFFSNGLVAEQQRVVEPVFGLDVDFAPEHENWSMADVFAAQPYLQFGVKVDEHLHPMIQGETQPHLYAIGSVLRGYDPLRQGCGGGVSMLTALSVANDVLRENP